MKIHQIKPGECLSSLAEAYGFHDPEIIYSHTENDRLKQKRDNLNVLSEGDKVKIPDKEQKQESGSGDTKFTFRVKGIRTYLRCLIEDFSGHALANKSYTLEVGDEVFEGKTTGDGLVEHIVLAKEMTGKIQIWLNDEKTQSLLWVLDIGDLDPYDKNRGVQARLNNLGYYCGTVDGIIGSKTKEAIKKFKENCGYTANEYLSPRTKDKLKMVYGF